MRPFRRLSGVLALLVVLLLANLSWVQVLDADAIRQREGNTRLLLEQYNKPRGPILVESAPIASSSHASGENVYQRSYVDGPLYAAVTGYYSLLYGATGIERVENGVLSGNDPRLFVDRVQQLFAGRRQSGGAVSLTLDASIQKAAFTALTRTRGAAVALNAKSGAVLALVSTPSFDPQKLAPNDPSRVRAAYEQLSVDAAEPLLNRALDRTYETAGAEQLVTAAAALASGAFTIDSLLPAPGRYSVPGTSKVVETLNGKPCSSTRRVTLRVALASNCATALAWLGHEVGADAINNTAQQLGFVVAQSIPLHAVASQIGGSASEIARATVLQMAMLGATIANHGSTMRPYLVNDVRGPDLALLERTVPAQLGSSLSTAAAAAIARALADAARPSCGDCGNLLGVHVLASSSTSGPASVIAYSGDVAVAVVIESTGSTANARSSATATVVAMLSAARRTS